MSAPRTPPAVAWSTSLFPDADPANFLPAQMVVDSAGRIYVAENASPNHASGPYEIDAIDPDGKLVWRMPFASVVGSLTLAADGTLWAVSEEDEMVVNADGGPPDIVLFGITREGSVKTKRALCGGQTCLPAFAFGADGSLFLSNPRAVERLLPSGMRAWRTDTDCAFFLPINTNLLTPSDDVVTPTGAVSPGGQRFPCDEAMAGADTRGALATAVAPSGDLVSLQPGPSNSLVLSRETLSGEVVATYPLRYPDVTVEESLLAIAADGTALVLLASEIPEPGNLRVRISIVALDADLNRPRWMTTYVVSRADNPFGTTDQYGLFVDPAGTIVITAGNVRALDVQTGSTLWQFEPAQPRWCVEPAVLAAGGAIAAAQCDGSVFLALSP